MVRNPGIVFICALACLAAACGESKKADDRPATTETAAQGPTCAQQVAALDAYLAALRTAETAIAADPLAVRPDAATTPETAVALAEGTGTAPAAGAFVVQIGSDQVYVNGQEEGKFAMRDALFDQLRAVACSEDADAEKPRDIVVVAAPDATWQRVERVIRTADEAGAAQILLGFAAPSGVIAPPADGLAPVASADPAVAFAACAGVVAALSEESAASDKAVTAALGACECSVSEEALRAFAYARTGLDKRAGRVPTTVALSFIDAEAGPKSERKVLSLAPELPWSQAHESVLAAIRAGGALVTAVDGDKVDGERLAVQTARGQKYCETLPERGVLGALEAMQGGAFARLTGTSDFTSGLDDDNVYGGLLGNEVGEMKGGFGFGKSSIGTGGGGTGWGTIGTGNYGTIGHGSGVSSGYGVGSSSTSSPTAIKSAQVRIGSTSVKGPLDKNIIRRYIRRKLPRIKYCYEKVRPNEPKEAGKVVSTFVIDANGKVSKSDASGISNEVDQCVAAVIKSIEFPKPKGGNQVQVTYPFTFQPSGP